MLGQGGCARDSPRPLIDPHRAQFSAELSERKSLGVKDGPRPACRPVLPTAQPHPRSSLKKCRTEWLVTGEEILALLATTLKYFKVVLRGTEHLACVQRWVPAVS